MFSSMRIIKFYLTKEGMQAEVLYWLPSLSLMLLEDAAMLALLFS
jgi:hypothetical protein